MRKILFNIFKKLDNSLKGKGILKNSILNRIYYYLYDRIRPHGFTIVNVNNYKMHVDPSDRGVSLRLLTRNLYENYETTVFKSLIKKGMTVVDVGSNIGYNTLLAASLVGREGRVFAFEPETNNFSMLKQNVEINRFKNVILVRKGVSNKNGTTRLFLNKKSKASHSIYSKIDSDEYIEIELISLDNFFKGKENSIDAIKIDVEGAEPKVWGGAKELLKRNYRMIIFTEFHPELLLKSGIMPNNYLGDIVKSGFKLYIIDEKTKNLKPADINSVIEFCKQEKTYTNLLCLKNTELEEVMKNV